MRWSIPPSPMRGGGQRRLACAWLTAAISARAGGSRAARPTSSSRPPTPTSCAPRRGWPTTSRCPTSRTPSRSPRAGRSRATTARALLGGLLELHAIPAREFPWQAELGDAFNSREAELVRRIGPDAAGWLSAGRPRREAFRVALRACARRGTAELADALADGAGGARRARPRAARRARRRLHLPPGRPADDGRAPPAGLRLPGAARRRAPAARPPGALAQRRGGRRQRRLALAARPRACSPSCSAATASSSTPRTRPGSGTSTPSCSRRSRSPRRTSRSSPRTSRSTRATSSA